MTSPTFAIRFFTFALVALLLRGHLARADDDSMGDGDAMGQGYGGSADHPPHPDWPNKPNHHGPTQVLWGQCGGYYYDGTTRCPPGSYCRYFSDWYAQCNPNNN